MDLLSDGQWHTLSEVQKRAKLNKDKIQRLTEFLKDYGFIVVNETKGTIRLDGAVQELVRQTSTP
jgi:DNA-binding IclR family transcriptional regulator